MQLVAPTCTYNPNKDNNQVSSDEFNFNELSKEFQIKNNIRTINIKDDDYFDTNLNWCNKSFYAGLLKTKMYYLKNDKNNIVVEEYIFNDNASPKKSFQIVEKYADFVRKLKRKDYAKRCYDIWDEQVYYAISKSNHIYLLTTINNLYFKDGNTSVDDIFEKDKAMLIDDLYNDLKNEKIQ